MTHASPPWMPTGGAEVAVAACLSQVLDPELDESIVTLGFVRTVRLEDGHATVTLQMATSWCALNFAFLMAEDVRIALLAMPDIHRVTVRLGDHASATEIETAVNEGRDFSDAFPCEGATGLVGLRKVFLRKGFLARQERL